MEREGWRILRFWANHVVQNPEGVWAEIEQAISGPPHLSAEVTPRALSPKGERNMRAHSLMACCAVAMAA